VFFSVEFFIQYLYKHDRKKKGNSKQKDKKKTIFSRMATIIKTGQNGSRRIEED